MIFWRVVAVSIPCLLFSGCSTKRLPIDWSNTAEVIPKISTQRDDFKKLTTYEGPNISGSLDYLFLRAWKRDSGSITYQIYVKDSYYAREWKFLTAAHDSNGVSLETVLIARNVKSCGKPHGSFGDTYCSYEEDMGISIDRAYLVAAVEGMKFKVSGRSGEKIFTVPAGYIQAFLAVVRQ